jgi:hypothetical protein
VPIDADEQLAMMRSLIDFIEQYRPGFSTEVEPADDIDMHILEDHAGPLPGLYRRFLRTMGKSLGEAEIADAYFGIDGIIATYHAMPWLKRDRYLLIAADEGLSERDYFMDRGRPYGADDCMIVRMPRQATFPPDANQPRFVGLEEFLYFGAFESLRMSRFNVRVRFETTERKPHPTVESADVSALAEQFGFRRVAPTSRCVLHDRGDAALLLYQHPIELSYSFVLGCDDPPERDRLKTAFENLTGMRGR